MSGWYDQVGSHPGWCVVVEAHNREDCKPRKMEKLHEYEVVMGMIVMAPSWDEAGRYADETMKEIMERDLAGPGADSTTSEPWLINAVIREVIE